MPVQPVQCGAAIMANVARAAIEFLYVYESKGQPRVRIPLSPPVHKQLNTKDLSHSRLYREWAIWRSALLLTFWHEIKQLLSTVLHRITLDAGR